jgi:hypothetical protein
VEGIMSLLLYTTQSDKTGKDIMKAIKTQFPNKGVVLCSTVNSLAHKLSDQHNDKKMAILVPADEEEVIDIYSKQHLFNEVPVVLVLPNREKLVIAMGNRLKPRLMCYKESGIAEVISGLLDTVNSLQLREAC